MMPMTDNLDDSDDIFENNNADKMFFFQKQ